MPFPTVSQWKQLPNILSTKEKLSLVVCLAAALVSGWTLATHAYFSSTKAIAAYGGTYQEGVIGTPRFLNPLYSDSYDVDRDITQLLFSSLLKYGQDGSIVNDIASDYTVSDDGKTYEFFLRNNALWSDGERLTADDVIYTVQIIQDPDYKSPLRARWLGVEVEKINDAGVRFTLKNPYAAFLETATLKIIPKHIWESIPAESVPLSPYNLNPIVSGPYLVKKLNLAKDNSVVSLDLAPNPRYFGDKPYISLFTFAFFDDYESLVTAFKRGVVKGFALNSASGSAAQSSFSGVTTYSFIFPRYFAVFFNPEKNPALSDQQVRAALNYATDKSELVQAVLGGAGKPVDSPILNDLYGFQAPTTTYAFDLAKAQEILEKTGYKLTDGNVRAKTVTRKPAFQFAKDMKSGSKLDPDVKELQKCLAREVAPDLDASGLFGTNTKDAVNKFQEKYRAQILDAHGIEQPTGEVLKATRERLNAVCFPSGDQVTPLEITIKTVNQPALEKTAQLLKTQWERVGARVTVETSDIGTLERESIKPREYQALLFGEVLYSIPDPFPFWHSSQKTDPGLNFALYENKDADALLKEARETMDSQTRAQKLEAFQNILMQDAPAVFLYSQNYVYLASETIKGIAATTIIDPSQRFSGAANWYVAEKRVWK